MRDLTGGRLYGIIDLTYVKASEIGRLAEAMVDGGVDVIQLRAKHSPIDEVVELAAELHQITNQSAIPFIVNDHAEVAKRVAVEGIHVGQDDDPVAKVRAKAGRPILVGKSTHSLEQAIAAQREGADYIGFGPIFATPTKPDYKPLGFNDIARVHADVNLPIFCIGGIKMDNLDKVISAGAQRVAIVSGLLKAPDIAKYARACKAILNPET